MLDPGERLAQIINTLDTELYAISDPARRAEVAREVAARGRLIEQIATERMRASVQEMRVNGASHADVGARLGVTRGRAQQLGGVPVRLIGGPKDGETVHPSAGRGGRPNRQLLVAVNGGAVNYWRQIDPEPDGTWTAVFYPGTQQPPDWTDDLTIT